MNIDDIEILELGLINNCVLECPMCTRRDEDLITKTAEAELPFEGLITFLGKLSKLKRVELVGTISEPTMYSELFSLLRYLKSRGLEVMISTNANVHNGRRFWTELGKILSKGDSVKFAIDGSTQEIYGTYRIKGNLNKVLQNHTLFKVNTKATSVLQFILFEHNEGDLESIRELFTKENFDLLEFLPCGEPSKGCRVLPETSILNSYEFKNKLISTLKNPTIQCFALEDRSAYLGHTGILVPCCDRDEETFGSSMPTIYDSSVLECIENLNSMLDARGSTNPCKVNCSVFSRSLYEKHEVYQLNQKGDSSYLDSWRTYIDV